MFAGYMAIRTFACMAAIFHVRFPSAILQRKLHFNGGNTHRLFGRKYYYLAGEGSLRLAVAMHVQKNTGGDQKAFHAGEL